MNALLASRRRRVVAVAVSVAIAALLLCGAAVEPGGSPAAPAPATARDSVPAHAFVGVTVLPMDGSDSVLSDRTVVIRGGRVVAVGGAGDVGIPADAVGIEGRGRFLIPGLADMHVHLERFTDPVVLELFVAHGVTTVRNMDGRPHVLRWRSAVARGELAGPGIVTAGPILEGPDPFWDDTRVVASGGEAASAVREQAEEGYDFVKVYHTLPAEAYRGVLAEAGERALPVAGHVPNAVGLGGVLDAGQRSIEHLDGFADVVEAEDSPHRNGWHWSKLYLGMPADTVAMERWAEHAAEAGTWITPTLVQPEKLAPLDVMRTWLDDPEVAYVPPELRQEWDPENWDPAYARLLRSMDREDLRILERGRRNREALVRELCEAGAGLLVGTDTPNPFVVPGVSVHEELENLVEAGLSPGDALAAATRRAAEFLGSADDVGTVEVGRRADLVLLEENPLESIGHTRSIAGVMVRGEWMPRDALDRILRRIRDTYRR